MSYRCHVYTNLMCTSGFQFTLYIREFSKTFKNLKMRYGVFAVFMINCHFFTIYRMSTNWRIDCSKIIFYIVVNNGMISSCAAMNFKLVCNTIMSFVIFTDDENTCKGNWMDFNAGALLDGVSMEEMRERLIEYVLKLASGETLTNAEKHGVREMCIFKTGVTL